MPKTNCLHCEAPLSMPLDRCVDVDGHARGVCSEACQTAAQTIVDKGLLDFYRYRDNPDGIPSETDPAIERWTGYDRTALQNEFVTVEKDGARTAHLLLNGVRCAACSWLVERGLGTVDGIESISVNPVTTRTDIRWNPAQIRLSQILSQIARLGFTPYPHTDDEVERVAADERRKSLKRLIVAGLGMMQVTTYAVALYAGAFQGMDPDIEQFFRLVSLLVATPIVLYSGSPFFIGAWRDLQMRSPGMDVPVALAIGGAYTASVWNTLFGRGEVYFDSATMFVFFLSAARHLEMAGRHRVLGLTDAFARHLPRIATRLVDGQPQEIGVMELAAGDVVLVSPGQTFPADGILEGADVQVDEALLTGESDPVAKSAGDRVVAGAINQRTAARFRVDRVGADTELAQIAQLMSAAQTEKPPIVQLANRVASWFVTGVLLAAAVVGTIWWTVAPERAFEIVLAVLVVTCPCALALATPAAFTVASSVLARNGFLVRRAGALEVMSRISDILFDKTGTLTDRHVTLRQVEVFDDVDANEATRIAAALEAQSEHPLARAFSEYATAAIAENVVAVAGEGLEGSVEGMQYRIGTKEFVTGLSDTRVPESARLSDAGRYVFLGDCQAVLARFELAESARAGAGEAVRALSELGITPAIASGDREATVREFAGRLGVDEYHAELKPPEKLALVRELQKTGLTVAMVGDGINDSPVLAGANVSVAMGSGTSLAQHSADCVLMNEDLRTLTDAFGIARRTMQIVRQNLLWAIAYNLVALPLAATGVLAPWMAALGMSASSLLVTGNALRIGHVQKTRQVSRGKARDCDVPPALESAR